MGRQACLVEAGFAFHLTARGNYRQPVFFSDDDRAEYLRLLDRYAVLEELDILGWCLMTNHVHLLAVPRQRAALARVMACSPATRSASTAGEDRAAATCGSHAFTRAQWLAMRSGRSSATSN